MGPAGECAADRWPGSAAHVACRTSADQNVTALPPRQRSRREPGLWQTFGPLAPYLMHEDVTDLFVTGAGELWADGGPRGLRRIPGWRSDESATRALAVRLISAGGRHIDEATPFVDVRLRGGVRVHAVLPPVSTGGTVLSVRIPSTTMPSLADLTAARRARRRPVGGCSDGRWRRAPTSS